jgi:hypothetical protein
LFLLFVQITSGGQLSAKVADYGSSVDHFKARKDDLVQVGRLIYLIHCKAQFPSNSTNFNEVLAQKFPNKDKDTWYNLIELCLTASKTDVTSKKILQFLEMYQTQLL